MLKRFLVGLVALIPLMAVAECLTNSAHDMTGRAYDAGHADRVNRAVCDFCHTPVGEDSSASVPVWQPTRLLQGSYQLTPTSMMQLSPITGAGGGSTYLCLTCHDGTQALEVSVTASPSGETHPVGVPYGGELTRSHQFDAGAVSRRGFAVPTRDNINAEPVWWVDTSNVDVAGRTHRGQAQWREKSDVILYTRKVQQEGRSETTVPYVECASCHDPHQCETQSFLRIDNEGSTLCVSCHQGV